MHKGLAAISNPNRKLLWSFLYNGCLYLSANKKLSDKEKTAYFTALIYVSCSMVKRSSKNSQLVKRLETLLKIDNNVLTSKIRLKFCKLAIKYLSFRETKNVTNSDLKIFNNYLLKLKATLEVNRLKKILDIQDQLKSYSALSYLNPLPYLNPISYLFSSSKIDFNFETSGSSAKFSAKIFEDYKEALSGYLEYRNKDCTDELVNEDRAFICNYLSEMRTALQDNPVTFNSKLKSCLRQALGDIILDLPTQKKLYDLAANFRFSAELITKIDKNKFFDIAKFTKKRCALINIKFFNENTKFAQNNESSTQQLAMN